MHSNKNDEVKFPSDELKRFIDSIKKLMEHMKQVQLNRSQRIRDASNIEELKGILTDMNDDISNAHIYMMQMFGTLQTTVDMINVVILRLPNKAEFDSIRTELTNTKLKVSETLTPLSEMMTKNNEQLRRGDTVYG